MNYVIAFLMYFSVVLFMSDQEPDNAQDYFGDLFDAALVLFVAWLLQ